MLPSMGSKKLDTTEQLNWTERQNWDFSIGLKARGGEWRKEGSIADLGAPGLDATVTSLSSLRLICQLSPWLLGPWPESLGLLVLPSDRTDIGSLGLGTFFKMVYSDFCPVIHLDAYRHWKAQLLEHKNPETVSRKLRPSCACCGPFNVAVWTMPPSSYHNRLPEKQQSSPKGHPGLLHLI